MKDIFAGNKRVVILQNIDRTITLSNEMIQRSLIPYGHSVSVEEVNSHLVWLESRNLLTIERLSENIWVARLTRHGKEVARGQVREPGVDDPVED